MSAETLRRAAALMRERAEAATPSPWAVPVANVFRLIAPEAEHDNQPMGKTPPYPWLIIADLVDGRAADVTHAASWHPAVALAVADWLDSAWHAIQSSPRPDVLAGSPDMLAALAVARAYLGES